ncbi:Cyclic nucleotide-gated potassium channel [Botrimarina colliarenosi]|uniref:Cyclic nucleotide-gated potassium channel n=1 Tax=Botrimarina colliarenosi TaxID=2528001 RepID=A0A5C6AMN5_9BACT|nr:ion transporter [Botrimarina colliarenosi]TWU00386.1 Cyclic nucleotide-gated potassium channel [Botrimarina colliarenosi]
MDHRPQPEYLETGLRPGPHAWQHAWYEVIFEAETPAGKAFDVVLLAAIVLSIAAVMLESVRSIREAWGPLLLAIEWGITLLFTAEFVARLACVARPLRYGVSFFGLVDIVSILPSYLALFLPGGQSFAIIRTLRLLRVFRVLKMGRHLSEANTLLTALRHTWPKITVFLTVIFCSIVILGTLMYLIEGRSGSGFDDIPTSVYWAIVTMTTVGYGDIAPVTPLGKFAAALIMLFGYAIIIVPTGIFSAEVMSGARSAATKCAACGQRASSADAKFCSACGAKLEERTADERR